MRWSSPSPSTQRQRRMRPPFAVFAYLVATRSHIMKEDADEVSELESREEHWNTAWGAEPQDPPAEAEKDVLPSKLPCSEGPVESKL